MIIVRLAGGLGNQIFQIGASLLMALTGGHSEIIIDDNSLSLYQAKRDSTLLNFFKLNDFDIDISFSKKLITKLRFPKIFPFTFLGYSFVSDNNFQNILKAPSKKTVLLDGYFQWILTQKNFEDILKILTPKFIYKKNKIETGQECVVHIRGGDFIKLGWNSITPGLFYTKSMDYMAQIHEIKKFIIVTDDIEYAKTILRNNNHSYEFRIKNFFSDFYTINLYSKRILSSSTFSFWASALGNNHNGTVIAPKFWFPGKKRTILLPNEIEYYE